MINALSLFSGMGGDTLGIEQTGINVVAFNEFDKTAINTHLNNFKNCKLLGNDKTDKHDILKISDSTFQEYKNEVDLIFAGFPCQGFSHGGKKLPSDPRNTLFREFIRAAKLIKPKYIIGENVDGLLSRKTDSGENFIDVIVSEFENIGYNITYKVCHVVQYGVPQLRKRLIIVGIRNDLNKTYVFPEPENNGKTNLPNLQNIVQFNMKGAIQIDKEDFDMSTIPSECILTDMNNDETEDTTNIHPYLRLKAKTRNETYNDTVHYNLLSFAKRGSPIHAEIIDIRKPSKTIICSYDHQPRLFVPLQNKNGYFIRCLLPDELKQIQGFPADFEVLGVLKQKIKQIGNAVPPPLIKKIVNQLIS